MLPAWGLMDQDTPNCEPCRVAVNCWDCPALRVAEVGVRLRETGLSVTEVVPVAAGSKLLVAVTVTFWLVEMGDGAVYRPVLGSMAPSWGLMLQVTPVWLMPETIAENCWVWPLVRVTAWGLTTTMMATVWS